MHENNDHHLAVAWWVILNLPACLHLNLEIYEVLQEQCRVARWLIVQSQIEEAANEYGWNQSEPQNYCQ